MKTSKRFRLLVVLLVAAAALPLLTAAVLAAMSEDPSDAVTLTFTDSGITASESGDTGCQIDAAALTINGAGTYILKGTCADGSVTVKKGTTGVTLVLSGLTLTSADTAPITCNQSTDVTIVAAAGTVNTLTDSAQNNDEASPDNENAENAVIKCKDGSNVILCGTGTLNVNANGKNGIKSGAAAEEGGAASLTIRELTLNITADVNDAINAGQTLHIESGDLTITAADDAIHSDYDLTIGASGTNGPTIRIASCYEGLEGAALTILSGDLDITSTDDCLNAANSDLTDYDFTMTISGGTITAYSSSGDGFDSNGDLTISGGTINVQTANSADNEPLDADGTITVSGGTVFAAGGSSGMGMNLSALQACVTFGGSSGMGGAGAPLASEGSTVTVESDSGSAVYSAAATCALRYVFFSSPSLTSGSSCTLCSDSTSAATATAQTGSVSAGMGGRPEQGGRMPGGFPENPRK